MEAEVADDRGWILDRILDEQTCNDQSRLFTLAELTVSQTRKPVYWRALVQKG